MDHNVSEEQREQEIPKKKVIRMLIIVVVVFAVCWLPVHVFQMHDGVSIGVGGRGAMWDPFVIVYICYWFSQANSAINPWLYIGLNGKMRAAFKTLIRCSQDEIPLISITSRRGKRVPQRSLCWKPECKITVASPLKASLYKELFAKSKVVHTSWFFNPNETTKNSTLKAKL